MRITSAPKLASHLVAPAPASCPVKSQMRKFDNAPGANDVSVTFDVLFCFAKCKGDEVDFYLLIYVHGAQFEQTHVSDNTSEVSKWSTRDCVRTPKAVCIFAMRHGWVEVNSTSSSH